MTATPARREYLRNYQNAWLKRRRLRAIALLGGKCIDCGSTKNLQIDHVDPKSKDSALRAAGTGSFWSWSWKRIEIELAKCVVRCKPCHQRKSATEAARGEQNGQHILSTEQVREIRRRVRAGESQAAVGRYFGVSRKHVYDLVHRRTRKYE